MRYESVIVEMVLSRLFCAIACNSVAIPLLYSSHDVNALGRWDDIIVCSIFSEVDDTYLAEVAAQSAEAATADIDFLDISEADVSLSPGQLLFVIISPDEEPFGESCLARMALPLEPFSGAIREAVQGVGVKPEAFGTPILEAAGPSVAIWRRVDSDHGSVVILASEDNSDSLLAAIEIELWFGNMFADDM